jgi:hypothetical protein
MMRESAEDWQIRDSVRISRKRKIVISEHQSEVVAGRGPLPSCSRQLADCIYDLGHCMQYLLFTGTYRYTEQFFVFGRRPCEKNRSIVLYFFLPATDGLIGIINSIVCTYSNLQSYMPTWLPLTAPPIVWGVTLPMPPSYEPD